MKSFFFLATGLAIVLSSCSPKGTTTGLTNSDMVGTWKTKQVEVTLRGVKNTARDSSFVIDPMLQQQMTSTQPPTTYIQADGSYRDEIRDPSGKIVSENKGFWHLAEDTLIMRMASQTNGDIRFGVRQKGNKMHLSNLIDWDADGKKDDEMTVELRKE